MVQVQKHIQIRKKNVPNKIIEKTSKKVNIKDDINKEYYRVSGLSKIKFMIFDFDQEMVVENPQKENKSEVENIIINYKLKLPTSMDKDSNDPSIKVNKFLLYVLILHPKCIMNKN